MDAQDKTIERRRTERPTAEAILAAACRAIVRRGVEATRIADIAREAGTSTGTVHYYFETKDDVLLAALESANDQPYARMDELLGQEADDLSRLATLLELSIPYPGPQREEWVFFLELWGRILHRPELLAAAESTDSRWRSYFFDVVRSGTANGTFRPIAPPDEVADRLGRSRRLVDDAGADARDPPSVRRRRASRFARRARPPRHACLISSSCDAKGRPACSSSTVRRS
jgi:AcrR family transcriptional regulator